MNGRGAFAPDLVFDEAQPTLDEHATATFSLCRTYRYALTRRWDPELPTVVWLMLNPSTADAFTLDPTVRRCIGFSRAWKAGGILVLNLFALRSTNPRALLNHTDPVGPDNDEVITGHLQAVAGEGQHSRVIAAWGVHGHLHGRDKAVAGLVEKAGVRLECLALTKDRHPRHPLYVPADKTPVNYRPGLGEQGGDTNAAGQSPFGESGDSADEGVAA